MIIPTGASDATAVVTSTIDRRRAPRSKLKASAARVQRTLSDVHRRRASGDTVTKTRHAGHHVSRFRDRLLPLEFEGFIALGHDPGEVRVVLENKGFTTHRLDAFLATIARTTPRPRQKVDEEKAKRPAVINAVARYENADATSRKAWSLYRAQERRFHQVRREVMKLGKDATEADHDRILMTAGASEKARLDAIDLWREAEGKRCCAAVALGLDPHEDKNRFRAIRRRAATCLHVWERGGFDDRRGRRDHTEVEWSRAGTISKAYAASLALHAFDAPVQLVSVNLGDVLEERFHEDGEGHEDLAPKFLVAAQRSVGRALRRKVPMIVRGEESDGDRRPHVHLLAPIFDHEQKIVAAALCRAAGEWGPASRVFQFDIRPVKDSGGISYLCKDTHAAARFQGVSLSREIRAIAQEIYEAMIAFVKRCRQAKDKEKPALTVQALPECAWSAADRVLDLQPVTGALPAPHPCQGLP